MSDEVKVKFVADTTGLQGATVPAQIPVGGGGAGGSGGTATATAPRPSGGGGGGGSGGSGGGFGGGGSGGGGGGGGGGNIYPWSKGWGDQFKKDLGNEAENMLSGINLLQQVINIGVKGTKEGIEYTQKIQAAARITDLSVEQVQKYGYAAKMSGVEFDTFVSAIANGNKAMGKMALEGGNGIVAMRRLGISIEGVRDHSVSSLDVILKMADAYQKHAETADMARLGNELYGDSFKQMIPMLRQGRAEIEKIANDAPVLKTTTVSGVSAAGRLAVNTGKTFWSNFVESVVGFGKNDESSIRQMGTGMGIAGTTSRQRADALLGRKDESISRFLLNAIGGFKRNSLDAMGARGVGETTSDVISKYEQVYGKDKEKMAEEPRAVYEELLKVREEELKNKPNLQSGIFQAASTMQQVGGGDVLSAISRVDFAQQTSDNTRRTADAVERLANGAGGTDNTPAPVDTNGPVAK